MRFLMPVLIKSNLTAKNMTSPGDVAAEVARVSRAMAATEVAAHGLTFARNFLAARPPDYAEAAKHAKVCNFDFISFFLQKKNHVRKK
jgi:hypothetical protein